MQPARPWDLISFLCSSTQKCKDALSEGTPMQPAPRRVYSGVKPHSAAVLVGIWVSQERGGRGRRMLYGPRPRTRSTQVAHRHVIRSLPPLNPSSPTHGAKGAGRGLEKQQRPRRSRSKTSPPPSHCQ